MTGSKTSTFLKTLAAFTGAALLFVVMFSGLYIMLEADHDCCGEDCHICETLETCQAAIHQIGSVPVTGGTAVVSAFVLLAVCLWDTRKAGRETPVSDKVQLNI